jgi:hypothetical protein
VNDQNLKRFTSSNEARENGRKGGIKSGISRRKTASIREAMKMIMSERTRVDIEGVNVDDATFAYAIALVQALKAVEGDTGAAVYCRDTMGEKPSDKVDLGAREDSVEVNIKVVGGGNNAENQS